MPIARRRGVDSTLPARMSNRPIAIHRVFGAFLWLGATCFGGPVAHLAVFHRKFVERSHRVSPEEFAEWLSLCQSLPGPTSSQMAIRLGCHFAGLPGAFAAWLGFTLPGALVLAAAGWFLPAVSGWERAAHGLEIFTASVAAHAVWTMARSLCPDGRRRAVALAGALVCSVAPGSLGQILAILAGGALGRFLPGRVSAGGRGEETGSAARGWGFLALFAGLFALLEGAVRLRGGRTWILAEGLYRSGSLVFGGGHVVLPLLRENVAIPLGVPDATFLWGYGLAQTMPGPLFNVAAFLGAGGGGPVGAAVAVASVFLPGALILLGVMPLWERLRRRAWFAAAVPGVNASVVGVLFAALAGPIREAAIGSIGDLLLATAGFAVLWRTRIPAWILAAGMTATGWFLLP
jgi:chromate transporter